MNLGKLLMKTNERGISVYQCSSVVCSFGCGQRLLCAFVVFVPS